MRSRWVPGSGLLERWLPVLSQSLRGAVRARAAAFAYAALLVMWGWRPFFPETSGQAIAVQFEVCSLDPPRLACRTSRRFQRGSRRAAVPAVRPRLAHCFAVWPLRLAGRWSNLWPALGLAVAIEAGHILICRADVRCHEHPHCDRRTRDGVDRRPPRRFHAVRAGPSAAAGPRRRSIEARIAQTMR